MYNLIPYDKMFFLHLIKSMLELNEPLHFRLIQNLNKILQLFYSSML